LGDVALDIEKAVVNVLDKGLRTGDIAQKGATIVGTKEMGQNVYKEFMAL
jgi:3-isopropylmalate dehydrogenase